MELSQSRAISEFAARRTQSAQVREFASSVAASHERLRQALAAATPLPGTEQAAGRGEITEELANVAERIQEEVRDRPPAAAVDPVDRPEETDRPLLQRLRTAAQDAGSGRGTARDRVRRVLPALRENLPEVVELVTEAIEEGSQPDGGAWLKLEQNFSQRFVQAMEDELARYRDESFNQAYLGYEILMHRRLEAALQTAQQFAGDDLRPTLDQGLQTVQLHLGEAREVMAGQPRAGASDRSR